MSDPSLPGHRRPRRRRRPGADDPGASGWARRAAAASACGARPRQGTLRARRGRERPRRGRGSPPRCWRTTRPSTPAPGPPHRHRRRRARRLAHGRRDPALRRGGVVKDVKNPVLLARRVWSGPATCCSPGRAPRPSPASGLPGLRRTPCSSRPTQRARFEALRGAGRRLARHHRRGGTRRARPPRRRHLHRRDVPEAPGARRRLAAHRRRNLRRRRARRGVRAPATASASSSSRWRASRPTWWGAALGQEAARAEVRLLGERVGARAASSWWAGGARSASPTTRRR